MDGSQIAFIGSEKLFFYNRVCAFFFSDIVSIFSPLKRITLLIEILVL